ncbi:MAG: hypothetical protein WBX17_10035 [Microbacterium sp.]
MTLKEEAALERFDRHMVEATGYTLDRYQRIRAVGPTSLAHIQLYGSLVDDSGAADELERWAHETRKSNAGRKPHMPFRALLILHLMHTDAGSNRYNDVAKTLFARLDPEAFDYLGITTRDGTFEEWYIRYWRSLNRLLALVSPWDVPRNTFLSAAAYRRALDSYSQERRDRMDEVMNRLAHASARRLPKEIRDTYAGNVALDATAIKLAGRPNPNVGNLHSTRTNLDAMSGRYRRRGNHEGTGHKKDEAAWEVETVVTVPNSPKTPDSFPILTTGLTMHHPGATKAGPLIAMKFHADLFGERGYVMVDRIYNNSKTHRFQLPIRQMGFRAVFNYKRKKSGLQGAVDDVILVGGCLYVKWMPNDLVTAHQDYHNGLITKEELADKLESRKQYRCKEKGRPDKDGSQTFFYPDVTKLMCIDSTTKKQVKPRLASKTFVIHPDSPEAIRIIKDLQGFEFDTPEWKAWMGLRSHVEGNNWHMKDDAHANLGTPNQRRPRGYAFQALVVASTAVASNMRRIVTFLQARLDDIVDKPTQRARRRRDAAGNRLAHHPETVSLRQ